MDNPINSRAASGSARVRFLKAKQVAFDCMRLLGTAVWHFCGELPELAFFLVVGIVVGAGLGLEALFPSLVSPLNAAWEAVNHWWKAHPNISYSIAFLGGIAILVFLAWRFEERTAMEVKNDIDLKEASSSLSSLKEAQTLDAVIDKPAHEEKPSAKGPRRL